MPRSAGPLIVPAVFLAVLAFAVYPQARLWLALNIKATNPQHPSIAILGDSHTEIVNWRILTGCDNVANFGVSGERSDQILARLPRVIESEPKLIVVMAGTNDVFQGVDGAITLRNMRLIEQAAAANHIDVVILTPPPLADTAVPALPEAIPVAFTRADLTSDQVHLRRTAYAKLRDAVAPFIERYCH